MCQYGDWLKAMGVRYGSPSKKKKEEFEPTRDADGETKKDGGSPTTVEAAMMSSTNPTEAGHHVNGNCSNHGAVTEVQAVTKPCIKETWPVTENTISNHSESMLEDPAVCEKLNTEGEAIKNGPSGGNNITKPKWTRLIRMDCGPGASKQSGPNDTLGKRSSSQLNRGDVEDVGEVYAEKRVRYQDDQLTIEAAGVSEHPCRSQ